MAEMPNGTPNSNGAPREAPFPTRPASAPGPTRTPVYAGGGPSTVGRLIHYGSIGLIVLMCLAVPVSIPYLRRDPLVWSLTLLFTGLTGASAGAMAGIVMVVFGGARGRRALMVAGLIVGLASFLVLALVIGWAIHKDVSTDGTRLNPDRSTPEAGEYSLLGMAPGVGSRHVGRAAPHPLQSSEAPD